MAAGRLDDSATSFGRNYATSYVTIQCENEYRDLG